MSKTYLSENCLKKEVLVAEYQHPRGLWGRTNTRIIVIIEKNIILGKR